MKRFALPFMLTVVVLIFSACAPSNSALTVQNAWARPASAGENGAAYFVIENGTASDDTMLSVSSDIAEATEIHMSMMDGNGVMSMQMQEAVAVPAKGKVEFKTGGLHVMFVTLNRDLKLGDTITLTLTFKEAGNLVIEVPVTEP